MIPNQPPPPRPFGGTDTESDDATDRTTDAATTKREDDAQRETSARHEGAEPGANAPSPWQAWSPSQTSEAPWRDLSAATAPTPAKDDDLTDLSLATLRGVLAVIRLVRLYTNRRTRGDLPAVIEANPLYHPIADALLAQQRDQAKGLDATYTGSRADAVAAELATLPRLEA